jgi:Tfp pilus assembly protein PilF
MHILYMAVHGAAGLSPWAYHLMNVLFHAGTSLLAFLVTAELLQRSSGRRSARTVWVSLLAALLFATHPIHSEAVAWVAGVPDLSFSFFYLLSCLFYVQATGYERVARLRYGASLLAFALALLSKEPALTLPVILLAHDWAFRRDRLAAQAGRLLPFFVVAAGYLGVRSAVLGGITTSGPSAPLLEWLPNVFSLFARYLGKLLLPIGLNIHYTISPAESCFDPPVLVGLLVTAAFAAALLYAWRASPVAFVSLAFIVVPLLPTLYIPGIGGVPFAERYLYLPSLGFAMLLALAVVGIAQRSRHGPTAVLCTGALLCALYAAASVARNRVWQDDYHLWSDAVSKSPGSDIAHNNLGRAYFEMGRMDDAIERYRVALELNADHAETHNNLGAAFATTGRLEAAERHFLTALRLKPSYSDAHNNIGILYGRRGDRESAIAHFRAALEARPDFPDAHHNLGVTYLRAGRPELAIEQLREALRLDPGAVNSQRSLADAYELQRRQRGRGAAH